MKQVKYGTTVLGNRVSCFRSNQLSGVVNSTLILSKRVVQNVFGLVI